LFCGGYRIDTDSYSEYFNRHGVYRFIYSVELFFRFGFDGNQNFGGPYTAYGGRFTIHTIQNTGSHIYLGLMNTIDIQDHRYPVDIFLGCGWTF